MKVGIRQRDQTLHQAPVEVTDVIYSAGYIVGATDRLTYTYSNIVKDTIIIKSNQYLLTIATSLASQATLGKNA